MPNVTEVRRALADAITAGTDLRAGALVQDQMVAPIAIVSRREFDPRFVFNEVKSAYQFRVAIYADRTNERASQEFLDTCVELSGVGSVIVAIQDGDNWTETVDYAVVTNVGEVQIAVIGEANYLVVVLDVEVVF